MQENTQIQTPVSGGRPYYLGGQALVKISGGEGGYGPEVYWLVEKKDQTLRPFESETALKNAFGEGFETAMNHVVVINPPKIDENGEIMEGILKDYNILSPEYAIKEDGSAKKLRFSPHQLKSRYGKPIDMNAEGLASEAIDGFMNHLKGQEGQTNIPAGAIDELKQDTPLMAFYISAIAYGGYKLDDIYADIRTRINEKE